MGERANMNTGTFDFGEQIMRTIQNNQELKLREDQQKIEQQRYNQLQAQNDRQYEFNVKKEQFDQVAKVQDQTNKVLNNITTNYTPLNALSKEYQDILKERGYSGTTVEQLSGGFNTGVDPKLTVVPNDIVKLIGENLKFKQTGDNIAADNELNQKRFETDTELKKEQLKISRSNNALGWANYSLSKSNKEQIGFNNMMSSLDDKKNAWWGQNENYRLNPDTQNTAYAQVLKTLNSPKTRGLYNYYMDMTNQDWYKNYKGGTNKVPYNWVDDYINKSAGLNEQGKSILRKTNEIRNDIYNNGQK